MSDYVPATFKIPQAPGVPLEDDLNNETIHLMLVPRCAVSLPVLHSSLRCLTQGSFR
jgi:hypothetical protein